jgi:hypothetical protein
LAFFVFFSSFFFFFLPRFTCSQQPNQPTPKSELLLTALLAQTPLQTSVWPDVCALAEQCAAQHDVAARVPLAATLVSRFLLAAVA